MSYRFCTLYSGSTGNAAYLETPGARILIDAGKCARTLRASLASIGVPVDSLDAILITHDHSDHVSALEVLTKRHHIPVHMLYRSALRYQQTKPEALCACLYLHKDADYSLDIGDVTVTAFPTPHDSRASVGYRFVYHANKAGEEQDICLGYATDIGCITEPIRENLLGCEAVVLESNHDPDMLADGPYPYELKVRIRSKRGHLSNRECAGFAVELAESGTHHLLLAHLSEQNNRPDLAYDETASSLYGMGVEVKVASPDEVTMLVGEAEHPIPHANTSVNRTTPIVEVKPV